MDKHAPSPDDIDEIGRCAARVGELFMADLELRVRQFDEAFAADWNDVGQRGCRLPTPVLEKPAPVRVFALISCGDGSGDRMPEVRSR